MGNIFCCTDTGNAPVVQSESEETQTATLTAKKSGVVFTKEPSPDVDDPEEEFDIKVISDDDGAGAPIKKREKNVRTAASKVTLIHFLKKLDLVAFGCFQKGLRRVDTISLKDNLKRQGTFGPSQVTFLSYIFWKENVSHATTSTMSNIFRNFCFFILLKWLGSLTEIVTSVSLFELTCGAKLAFEKETSQFRKNLEQETDKLLFSKFKLLSK